ncbi:MAG TPA: tRNA (adenosine(37)-N6)-dimethylallyltransferase MiaA [Rhizomicrobium sp.]|jgi:tRNA dimethylallyltransferase
MRQIIRQGGNPVQGEAVLIAGATASGKSAAALALAEAMGGVVINTDSMQVYREARILTARPGEEEMARVPHLLYGHVPVSENYSVARFVRDAAAALKTARSMGRVPIFVGGTGLYFAALTQGLVDMPPISRELREALRVRRQQIGAEAFHAALAARDPAAAARLSPSDTTRVLRAYEVFEATGRPLAEWQEQDSSPPLLGADSIGVVLDPPREDLYRRIDARFLGMLAAGALEEAARLRDGDPAQPASKILGLRELWAVLDGVMSLSDATVAAQLASRHYAKRQMTWFRNRMAGWRRLNGEEVDGFVAEAGALGE